MTGGGHFGVLHGRFMEPHNYIVISSHLAPEKVLNSFVLH